MPAARRASLALLTAALLAAAMPGEISGLLAWAALAPLVVAVEGCGPLPAAGLGLLAGAASALATFRWVFGIPGFGPAHAALLAVWLGLFPAAWCAGLAALARSRLPVVAAAPLLWAGLEWLRGNAGFLALPWGTLAQTQHGNLPLLQAAALAGEPGVSFLVAAAGVALGRIATAPGRREALAVAALVAAAHAGGAVRLALDTPAAPLRVALVQPSILAAERATPAGYAATLDRLEALTRAAALRRPELVVWPETAVRDLAADAPLLARLDRLAADVGAPILAGSSSTEKMIDAGAGSSRAVRANEALLVPGRGGAPSAYRKSLLVPFAETLPLAERIRWPAWLARGTYGIERGDGPRSLLLPGGTPVAPAICWENLFPAYVRRAAAGARLIVVLTNDAWAGRSAAPEQHNAASALRAVENGVPVVVASNGGPSIAVDRLGRVLARSAGTLTRETVTADVPLGEATTPFARFGAPPALAAILVAAGALALAAGCAGRKRRRS